MKKSKTILVVCRGNIARSPFAEAIVRQELELRGLHGQFRVISRGVQGTAVDPEPVRMPNLTYYPQIFTAVQPILVRLRIDCSAHRTAKVTAYDVRQAGLIVAMDKQTQTKLGLLFPRQRHKVRLFTEVFGGSGDIVDPDASAAHGQAQIFLQIRQMIVGNFPRLLAIMEAKYE